MKNLTMTMTMILLTLTTVNVAYAFNLKCEANDSYHALVVGHVGMDCENPKTGTIFTSNENEYGVGLRTTFFDTALKFVNIRCPFMSSKKLDMMEYGEKLKVVGVAADADVVLIGKRLGFGIGKPGICFMTGHSFLELGASAAVDVLTLVKRNPEDFK